MFSKFIPYDRTVVLVEGTLSPRERLPTKYPVRRVKGKKMMVANVNRRLNCSVSTCLRKIETAHITSFISLEIIYKMVNILLQPRANAVKTYIKCKVDQVFHHRLVHIQARQNMLHMIEHVR